MDFRPDNFIITKCLPLRNQRTASKMLWGLFLEQLCEILSRELKPVQLNTRFSRWNTLFLNGFIFSGTSKMAVGPYRGNWFILSIHIWLVYMCARFFYRPHILDMGTTGQRHWAGFCEAYFMITSLVYPFSIEKVDLFMKFRVAFLHYRVNYVLASHWA